MLVSASKGSSISYLPLEKINGFDKISPDLMECIGEYVECLVPGDQPSWRIYKNAHYFHVLFKSRIHEERRRRIEKWEKELNAGFSLFQDYMKTVNFHRIFQHLDGVFIYNDRELSKIVDLQQKIEYHTWSASLTLRETWLEYLTSLKYDAIDLSGTSKNQIIKEILRACKKFDPENNGNYKSLVPMRPLREMALSMQKTSNSDIHSFDIADFNSYEFLTINIRSHSVCKKILSCSWGVCLIASHILNNIYPENSKNLRITFSMFFILGTVMTSAITMNSEITMNLPIEDKPIISILFLTSLTYVTTSVIFAALHHSINIHQKGIRNAYLHQKESLKETAVCVKYIWHMRELLTDVVIGGIAAHTSIAMKSVRREIRRLLSKPQPGSALSESLTRILSSCVLPVEIQQQTSQHVVALETLAQTINRYKLKRYPLNFYEAIQCEKLEMQKIADTLEALLSRHGSKTQSKQVKEKILDWIYNS